MSFLDLFRRKKTSTPPTSGATDQVAKLLAENKEIQARMEDVAKRLALQSGIIPQGISVEEYRQRLIKEASGQ